MGGESSRLALILVVAFPVLIVLAIILNVRGLAFNPPYLSSALIISVILGTGIIIAFLAAKSYIRYRTLNLLLLADAFLILGFALTIASFLSYISLNAAGTVGPTGIFLSSIILFLSAIKTPVDTRLNVSPDSNRKITVVALYLASLLFIVALTALAMAGLTPAFLTSTGSTLLRFVFLATASVLFVVSCVVFSWRYVQSKSPVLYWYALGLGLLGTAFVPSQFFGQAGDLINWLTRLPMYLSGIYFLVALSSTEAWLASTKVSSERVVKQFRRLGSVLPFVLLAAIAVVTTLGLGHEFVFNPPYLVLILNTLFLTGTGIAVAAVSAKSFLNHGSLNVLMLGSAVLISGLVAVIAGVASSYSANYNNIIYNTGIMVSSVIQFASAFVSVSGIETKGYRRKSLLALTYMAAVVFTFALTALTFLGFVPEFVTASGETTSLRGIVLGASVFFFASSCLLFMRQFLKSRSHVLYWYSMGLGLFAVGLLSATLVKVSGEVLTWLSRLTVYAGGFYFLVSVRVGVKAEPRSLTDRWAEAFRQDRRQVDLLFANMADSFAYCKMIYDLDGRPVDYVFLDINDAFTKFSGIGREIIGRKATEANTIIWEDHAELIEVFGRVASTGQPERFEYYSQSLGKWFSVSVYCPEKGYFAITFEDTTERKKAEDEVRSVSLFPSENPYPIFRVGRDGTVLYSNPAGLSLLSEWKSAVGQPVPEHWRQLAIDILSSGESKWIDETHGEKTFSYVFVPIAESGYVNIYGRDITDRKKMENQLEEYAENLEKLVEERTKEVSDERQRLYSVLETLPVYVILLDKDHHVPFANKFFRERFGVSQGRRCFEYLFKRSEPCENCETYKVIQTNVPHNWEWLGPDKRNYDIYDFPFIEADGSTLIMEMGIDITEEKHAQDSLRSASQYVRSLIEASLDPLVTISADGKITDVNEATVRATGVSREEIIGTDFSSYFTEPEKARAGYQSVFRDGVVKDYPLAIRHVSGKVTEVTYNATVYRNEAGEIQGVFAAARDVTEHNELERRMKDSERLAAIGATAGMVGHDLRNPLQAIEGSLFLAKEDLSSLPESAEKQSIREMLESIDEQYIYMNKIVSDLQDMVRPINLDIKEVEVQSIIDSTVKAMKNSGDVEFKTIIGNDARKLTVDPVLVMRVLTNLVTNAVQAMPNGGNLTISALKEGDSVLLSVSDTGEGIPEDVKPKLFTPLFTTKAKGQGFGLAVCKRVIEAHGGTITFESELGKGTTFTIKIPNKTN